MWGDLFLLAAVFEVGSATCGAAPSFRAPIVRRAIAGLGVSGVFCGSVIITFHLIPLHKRPIYSGIISVIFAISQIVGPLIGGLFTSNVSWRWCFYLNLSIGAIAMAIIVLYLQIPPARNAGTPLRDQISQMDPL
ncbi:hypothetical protein Egran_05382 [Elaphomyces granulatus]|uniref:Major facilitator superfamily (MFS) profile domain-containing protein n=1 Tax=Elaphomyces granulatus TaxID=519963 RepID=A0A232LRQ7_9EURO|nr:hypothetical protein Egran_05382 [Elaphomyces granulatus]